MYVRFLGDGDVQAYMHRVGQRYLVATLERLAEQGARDSRRAAILALGHLGDYDSNAVVGRALIDRDRTVRTLAETAIRSLWCRSGTTVQRRRLAAIIRLNHEEEFEAAARAASELIDRAPWIAEAWNQRAIAHYSMEKLSDAVADCHQALEINPYHFGAAAGMGYCYVMLHEVNSAMECFRRALRLNPGLEGVRTQLIQLQRSIKEEDR